MRRYEIKMLTDAMRSGAAVAYAGFGSSHMSYEVETNDFDALAHALLHVGQGQVGATPDQGGDTLPCWMSNTGAVAWMTARWGGVAEYEAWWKNPENLLRAAVVLDAIRISTHQEVQLVEHSIVANGGDLAAYRDTGKAGPDCAAFARHAQHCRDEAARLSAMGN